VVSTLDGQCGALAFLVLPVGCDTVLSTTMHVVGPDLQLHRRPLLAEGRGVPGLVHVELRHGDVVLEPARQRVPPDVQDAERGITVAVALDKYPEAHQIVDLLEVSTAN